MRVASSITILLLAACSREPIPAEDLLLEVSTRQREVELGEAFLLDVRRVWRSDSVPSIWSDDMLAPLRLELIEAERNENDTHTQELRRYRARAFSPGSLAVAGISFRSRGKTSESEVFSEPLDLTVRSAIDPERPGAIERPERRRSTSWIWFVALGVPLLLWIVSRRKHTPVAAEESEVAARPAHEIALARIAAIADDRIYRDSLPVVRDYLSVDQSCTSQDLALRFPAMKELLSHSIEVRFGNKSPTDAERRQHRTDIEDAIRELAR